MKDHNPKATLDTIGQDMADHYCQVAVETVEQQTADNDTRVAVENFEHVVSDHDSQDSSVSMDLVAESDTGSVDTKTGVRLAIEEWKDIDIQIDELLDVGRADGVRELCKEMLQKPGLHLFKRSQCHYHLSFLADNLLVKEVHLEKAEELWLEIFFNCSVSAQPLWSLDHLITEAQRDLNPKLRAWKLEEGLLTCSKGDESGA